MMHLPPELAARMGVPDPDPERERAVQELREREAAETFAGRRRVLAWGALLCSCRTRFDWDDPSPPQAGCNVHGFTMITPGGEVL